MSVKRAFNDRHQFFDVGVPLSGGKLFFYAAGSSTKQNTYNSSSGSTANSNPMVLDSAGRLQTECWLTTGLTYKLVLTTSTDSDPPSSPIWSEDVVGGINDSTVSIDQWQSGPTPTFSSANSFTLAGDQTSNFHANRAVKMIDGSGENYSHITASVFGALTTVTIADSILDSGLSAVSYSLLSASNRSIPLPLDFFSTPGANGSAAITDSTQTKGYLWVPQYPKSLAPNPFFQVDQLVNSATSVSDDNYGHDHWYVLTQTASVQVSTQTLQENGQSTNALLTQNQAGAQRMGYACIIEAAEAQKYRGRQITFKPRLRISNSQAVRIAVIEWTGTADSVTSDIVNDWTSSDYTDGAAKFFVDANQAPLGTSAVTPSAATWTDATALAVTVGGSCNNLILFVWTEGTAAQNVTLGIGKIRLVPGTYAGDIEIPTFDQTLRYAMRFFEKSFPYATAPVQNGLLSGSYYTFGAFRAGAVSMTGPVQSFATQKRTITGTVTGFNPSAANANVRDVTAGVDGTTTAAGVGDKGLFFTFTGNAATAIGNLLATHWTVSDRL